MPKLILTRSDFPPQGVALLETAVADGKVDVVAWNGSSKAERTWLLDELRKGDVDALLCTMVDTVDEELLKAAGPSLKVVSTLSAGFDHVTLPGLKSRGIRLGTTPDALTDATADVGAMLVLMASRRAGEGLRAVVDGKWPAMPWAPLLLCGHGLQRSTVGVLGFGKIGQLTLKRLLGFGISRALYATSSPGATLSASKDYFGILSTPDVEIRPAVDLKELAEQSDFLVVCCALSNSTKGLVGKEFIAQMKKSAYIVNTARGPVVDSEALVEAVDEGRLAGAGLDVVTGEPNVSSDHPLLRNPKIVVLPHIGSATYETRGMMAEQAVRNAFAGLALEGSEWVNEVAL